MLGWLSYLVVFVLGFCTSFFIKDSRYAKLKTEFHEERKELKDKIGEKADELKEKIKDKD